MTLGSDISSQTKAWDWICEQITVGALHPQWIRRSRIDQLGILFADLFRRISGCRLPIYTGPTVASQFFSCLGSITDLRIAQNGWALTSNNPN